MNFGFRILDFGLAKPPRVGHQASAMARGSANQSGTGDCDAVWGAKVGTQTCCVSSIQNPKSKIQNCIPFSVLLILAVLSGCVSDASTDWTEDQRAVHAAMSGWSSAASKGDIGAMWDALTPDAQDVYQRELTGKNGVRESVLQLKAALEPGTLAPPEEQARVRKVLATLPESPDKMTAKDYYEWRVKPDLTPQKTANTAQLFAKANIKEISVTGDSATVLLNNGDPDRYTWKKVGGVWKFDLPPSILRALETVRRREAGE